MTSRKGIYLNFTKKLIDGKFFGLTHQGPIWYAFGTHADDIHAPSFQGYILQFEIDSNGNMVNQKEIITGLDNGVHQMCIWKDHLYVLETYIQRITIINLEDYSKTEIYPFDKAISAWYQKNGLEGSYEKYIHINAITVQDDRFYIMCPHLKNTLIDGHPSQERNPSHIVMFSPDWKTLDVFDTGRFFCHDLVVIGHEIYFADATNTICKLNIVTREVEQVWTVDPVSPDLRKICRGLSICQNGQSWVGTHDLEDKRYYAVDFIKKQHIEVEDTPCCIKRLDGTDFNDETSHLKKAFTLTYPSIFNNVTSLIFNTLKDVHRINEKPGSCKFQHIKDFLNPDFSKLTNESSVHTTCIRLQNLENKIPLPPYLTESGPFYMYPENHLMDWHTNEFHMKIDNELFNYRMYTVNTTGNSYFMYKHPISGKIHAIKDIDGTSLVFNLFPKFWHAVICTKGSRLSYGVKFSEEAFDIMGIDNIWESPKKTFRLIFPLPINNNIFHKLQNENFMNENEINNLLTQLQNCRLSDSTVGKNTISTHRKSKVYFIPKIWEFSWIYNKIFHFICKINTEIYKFNLTEIENYLQYTEYDESYQGHYDWHMDIGLNENSCRKLSLSIQLSDSSEYEGGELQINMGGNILTCCKSKGAITVFPSFLLHRVTPVTKGMRRSLVLWVSGPPFV